MDVVRTLFREYQAFLDIDLCFQGFAAELADLPGKYAPPGGCILLAEDGGAAAGVVAGVVALWPLAAGACEMKRLFVRPPWRGTGLGRRLAEAVVDEARAIGYTTMRLDTLARLDAAVALYRSLGFRETAPYTANPEPDVIFMARGLPKRI